MSIYLYNQGNIKKKLLLSKSNEENLDSILYYTGEKFLRKKILIQKQGEPSESLRIYASDNMLDILIDKNYTQFFIDGTFKCVPKGIKNHKKKIKPF